MKIISFNVNSIRKGIKEHLEDILKDVDIICFQETKAIGSDIETYFSEDEFIDNYPYRYYNDSVSGQAGVGIWSKIKPIKIITEIPRMFQLNKGRVIILEFKEFTLLNTYVPNTGREVAEEFRRVWHNSLINYLESQITKQELFIWCGDLNVIRDPALDTSHHKTRPTKPCAGMKLWEKEQFDEYLNLGLIDTFRYLYPEIRSFTWYSNFSSAKNIIGWRLDYFLVSNITRVKNVIHFDRLPKSASDHVPILLELD